VQGALGADWLSEKHGIVPAVLVFSETSIQAALLQRSDSRFRFITLV